MTERSTNASLKKRDDSSLEACYRDVFREMKQLVDGPEGSVEDGMEKSNGKVRHILLYCSRLCTIASKIKRIGASIPYYKENKKNIIKLCLFKFFKQLQNRLYAESNLLILCLITFSH